MNCEFPEVVLVVGIYYLVLLAVEFLLGFGSFPFTPKHDTVILLEKNDTQLWVESVVPDLVKPDINSGFHLTGRSFAL